MNWGLERLRHHTVVTFLLFFLCIQLPENSSFFLWKHWFLLYFSFGWRISWFHRCVKSSCRSPWEREGAWDKADSVLTLRFPYKNLFSPGLFLDLSGLIKKPLTLCSKKHFKLWINCCVWRWVEAGGGWWRRGWWGFIYGIIKWNGRGGGGFLVCRAEGVRPHVFITCFINLHKGHFLILLWLFEGSKVIQGEVHFLTVAVFTHNVCKHHKDQAASF